MVDLSFVVISTEVERFAVTPSLRFVLEVTSSMPVENIVLQSQLRIEPMRRAYIGNEREKLRDLFGDTERWGETLKTFLWAIVPANISAFEHKMEFALIVPCSLDFNIAATKYFHGLETGDVPMSIMFSGSVFYRDDQDRLQIAQIAWTNAIHHRLPAQHWRDMMDHYYPHHMWLPLGRETFEKLYRAKRQMGSPTLENALDRLLARDSLEKVA